MISYNNSEVIQCLRQYEMFANSLKLIRTKDERNMIIKQLTKLEMRIIALTNEVYEEEYNALYNKKSELLDEEKNRITMLIDLINQRLSYVEKRCTNHYQLTGYSIDVSPVLGADILDELEDRVKIIDKYSKNVRLEKELREDVKSLSSKISLASEKIDINKSLNIELENTFKNTLKQAFEKNNMYSLLENKDEIEYAYNETAKSLELARKNMEVARTSPMGIFDECEEMFNEVNNDYVKYKEQMSVLELLQIYDAPVNEYEDLLNKRKEINEIIKYIENEDFLCMVMDVISKQYNTILMEQQDINTFNDLVLEKERKLEAISEIEDENESEAFQDILRDLIANEKKRQEAIMKEQQRIEEEEKKKKQEIERKRQEEILKKQKVIEEARKKEIEKRTKQLLEQQQNSVLQAKKKEKTVSFETIKDETDKEEPIREEEVIRPENVILTEKQEENDRTLEVPLFKNKVDIEQELFDEFNKIPNAYSEVDDDSKFDKIDEVVDNNKLPSISLDEYMRTFDEKNVDNVNNLFEEEEFPNIPM